MGLFSGGSKTVTVQPEMTALEASSIGQLQQAANQSGLNEQEQLAIKMAQNIANGNTTQDIRTNPYYQSQQNQAQYATDLGLQRLRRQSQLTGTQGSTGAANAEAQYVNDIQAGMSSILGDLQQQELQRSGPLAQMQAAQYGSDIQTGALGNQANQYGGLMDIAETLRMISQIANYPSIFSQVAGPVAQLASGFISATPQGNKPSSPAAGTGTPATSIVPTDALASGFNKMYQGR